MNNTKSDDETEDEPSQELYDDKKEELATESRNSGVAKSNDAKNEPKPNNQDWIQKGILCMALYSGDNLYYRAVIQEVLAEDQVKVIFIGFESEGKEQVSFKHLKRVPQNIIPNKRIDECHEGAEQMPSGSFFTHLEGFEMDEELRTKYEDFGDNEFDILQDTKHNKSQRRKRKGVLDVSTHKNNKLPRRKQKRKASLNMSDPEFKPDDRDMDVRERTIVKKRLQSQEQDDWIDECCDMDGFNDKDMEKPHFSEPAPYPFVPLVLSEPGVEPPIQVPATINCRLRKYQRDGVKFLYEHYYGNKGAILGDDMGLGKTVQVIAFLAAVLGKTGTKVDVFGKYMNQGRKGMSGKREEKRCFLIVSPGSVLYNWRDELDTWGHFKVKVYHGNKKDGVLEEAAKNKLEVVLTTYDTLRINLKKFNKVSWSAVIMDEVHKLKDPEAQVTVAARALDITRRFGLTGTPLQNRFDEFWSVLDWANPGCLGSARIFTKEYSKPVKKGQRYDVTKRELAIGRTISKNFQARLHGQWFLRRTKDLISDQLPQKDERVVFCNLTSFQEDVYVTLLQSPDVQLITKKDHPCDCGSGLKRGHCCYTKDENGESLRSVLMRYLQLMLKAANHTALLMPQVKQTEDQRIKAQAICDKVFFRHPEYAEAMAESSFQTLSDPSYCGKMKVLDQLLRMFEKEKSKVLLFSQSTQLLNILEEYLIGCGMMYSRLDGKTKTSLRPVIVREFNNNPETFVCLVSTKAGALGLNFTGANVVIIFDPTWNPANDLQAQDRAYRIGQRRNVQVFRLITSGTIEEMIYLRQVYKQQMANIAVKGTSERRYFIGVEGEKDLKGELFGMENLFSYRAEGVSLTHDIIQRTDKLEAGLRIEKYRIVARKDDGMDEEVDENEDDDKNNTNEDEEDYDLEEMASQYFDDECETEPRDWKEASGINTNDNGGNKQTCTPDEKLTMCSAQTSSDDESSGSREENIRNMKEKTKMKKKRIKAKDQIAGATSDDDIAIKNAKNSKVKMINKKRRKILGAPRAKEQRARRLRKYVAEFVSCSGSSSNETSVGSEGGDRVSPGDGSRMDGKLKVDREIGRQEEEDSVSEVEVEGTDEQGTSYGQTDQNTDPPGYRCQRTDKNQDTDKGKTRRKKTIAGQTDIKKGETSDTDNKEKSDTSAVLDTRRRFTRIRQKEAATKRSKYSKLSRQRNIETTDCRSEKEFNDNQEGCLGNDGYLSMSCDESSQSNHEEDAVVPSRKAVSRGPRKRDREESSVRKKKSLSGNLTPEDQGMDDKESKVEEILNKCGVRYTHANRSVVRTSKAESHMTKRAIEDVLELRQFSQQPANCFAAFEASEESDDVAEFTTCQSKSKSKKQDTKNPGNNSRPNQEARPSVARSKSTTSSSGKLSDGTTELIDGATVIVGGTPRGIRRNQFREMSRCFGFTTEVDFAANIANQTAENHRELLKTFYNKCNPDLMRLKYFAEKNIEKATASKREKKSQIAAVKSNQGKDRKCKEARSNGASGTTGKRKGIVKTGVKMTSVGRGGGASRRGVVFGDDEDDDDDDDDLHKGNTRRIFRKRKQKKRPCIKDDDDDDESVDHNEEGDDYQYRKTKVCGSTKRNINVAGILESHNSDGGSGEAYSSAQKTTETNGKQRNGTPAADDDDDGDKRIDGNKNENNDKPQGNEDKNEQQEMTTGEISPRRQHIPQDQISNPKGPQPQCIASSSLSILDEFFGPTRDQKSADTDSVSVDHAASSRPWQRRSKAQYTHGAPEGGKNQQSKKSILDDFI